MNDDRLVLDATLRAIPRVQKVYYQPPENISMVHPCIVYKRDDIINRHADNSIYGQKHRFTLTVIDDDPDSSIVEYVSKLPKCRFETHFASAGLNHDVFSIYT